MDGNLEYGIGLDTKEYLICFDSGSRGLVGDDSWFGTVEELGRGLEDGIVLDVGGADGLEAAC